MRSWRFEVVSGLGTGFVVAVLGRLGGVALLDSALAGTAFAVMWILTGLFLRRRHRRR